MVARVERRWVAAVVWTIATLGVHGGRYYLACEIQCCNFLPRCDGATSMNCLCPDTSQILLRNGDIPPSVEYIEISSAKRVSIGEQALYELYALRDLTVRDVDSLEVNTDGLALSDSAGLQTLRLERMRTVQLHRDALSGRWPDTAEVALHHIGYLHLEQRAFHFTADRQGPHVLLEHVSDLHAKADAFRATIRQLSLVNVSMRSCQPGTFRGRLQSLSLLGSSLQSVESRCVQPDDRWESVSFKNCNVGEVRERALTGDVGTLLLEASNVTRLHQSAVQMSLERLELSRVHMQDMQRRALDVSVCESVVVVESRVRELRRQALAGIRLADCARQDVRPFTIHLLHVGAAESGALAVHETVPASAVNWDSIMFDTQCSCEMRGDVSRLVAGDSTHQLSDAQWALVNVVYDRGFCSDPNGRPERLADAATGCPDWPTPGDNGAGRDSDDDDDDDDSSLDQNIVFYGVIGAAVLLTLVLLTVLFAKRRRVGRVLGCGDSPEPAGCDTLQSRRTAATSTLSSVVGASTLDSHLRYDKGLPDLLNASPGVDLSPPRAQPAHEHIYAEISPAPAVADYADPRDSVALGMGGGEPARECGGLYAEIAPLVAGGRPPSVPPPPPPQFADDTVFPQTDERNCPITEL